MTLGKLFNFTVSQFPPHNENATFTKLLSMHIKHLQVNTRKALDSVWLLVNAIPVWAVTMITIYYHDCYHYCFCYFWNNAAVSAASIYTVISPIKWCL